MFTSRPELLGTFGAAATTHWIATAVAFGILERGGNAFDAGIAAAFVLQVVEPHLVGPGGDVPIIVHPASTSRTEVICGQAPAPAGATVARYRAEGLTLIPGDGMLATVIPGSFDAFMLLLARHGTMTVRDVLEPAIFYAACGHPLLPRVAATIAENAEKFRRDWPTSAAAFLPHGAPPEGGTLFRNEALAATWRRIVAEAEAAGADRVAQIEAARAAWSTGFVAEAIDDFVRRTEVMDESGARHRGVLCADDMAGWQATVEAPLTLDYRGHTVNKIPAWGQGPVFLQTLALLKGFDLDDMEPTSARFIHVVTEALKLSFADREVYYGDPKFVDVPIETLLSESYAAERRGLIGHDASHELRPGHVPGYEDQVARSLDLIERLSTTARVRVSEPTAAAMQAARGEAPDFAGVPGGRGDTVHIDVVDRWGNMMAAMPSGGWLQSSPMIPALGFMLNSRAQMFWLEEGLPASLAPGKRPRTTLTPTLTTRDGEAAMAFGSPGGDQQEQWQLLLFLRAMHHGLNLQEAIDLPMSHTSHFPSSFHPRNRRPGHLAAEETFGPAVLDDLRRRGHDVEVAPAWTIGRLVAVARDPGGILRAAATPRLMQAYAIAR